MKQQDQNEPKGQLTCNFCDFKTPIWEQVGNKRKMIGLERFDKHLEQDHFEKFLTNRISLGRVLSGRS